MKNVAIILAGGIGSRMGGPMPKQFLSLNDKPVIVHTLENFQKKAQVDSIIIVCVKDWISHLNEILEEYKISKVLNIVEGGGTGHDSTRNGIFSLRDYLADDDYVIIHDAARPILPQAAINDMLREIYNNPHQQKILHSEAYNNRMSQTLNTNERFCLFRHCRS